MAGEIELADCLPEARTGRSGFARATAARGYLDALHRYQGAEGGRRLALHGAGGELAAEASRRGFEIPDPDGPQAPDGTLDACVSVEAIEYERDAVEFLSRVHRALKPNGVLLLVTRASGGRAMLENALARTGFRSVEILSTRAARVPRRSDAGTPVIALARAGVTRARPLVSIIVPVYNEQATAKVVLEQVIAKTLIDADKEIIVVEGNSTDGTRETVQQFAHLPGVRLLLQDRPTGKGSAVREGLRHATGDIILIQDADLEYDIEDYDRVLEPVRTWQRAVVLGSRHGSGKMRVFIDQRILGRTLNAGHVLLTGLFNLLYRQRLKDPWTMYKVFRTECLHGLRFECNRFNFDIELMAKLVRKGYQPVEIPIKYTSRSFKAGKKVNVLRDPWTWVWACLKYRVVSPYNSAQASRLTRP